MRHSKHIKVIQSQVEILEDLNCDLERLVDFIKNLVKQGTSWMNESESKLSFVQINQLLTSETANCIQKCINIACENEETSDTSQTSDISLLTASTNESFHSTASDLTYQDDKERQDMREELRNHSGQLEQVNQTVTDHGSRLKTLARKNKENEAKVEKIYDDMMNEFHSANEFMSGLQKQIEMLTNECKERETMMSDIMLKQAAHEKEIKQEIIDIKHEQDDREHEMKKEISHIKGKQDVRENETKKEISHIKEKQDIREYEMKKENQNIKAKQDVQENEKTFYHLSRKSHDVRVNESETFTKNREEKIQTIFTDQNSAVETCKRQWDGMKTNRQSMSELSSSSEKSNESSTRESSRHKDDTMQRVIALESQFVGVSFKVETLLKDKSIIKSFDSPAGFVATCVTDTATNFYADKLVTSFCDVSTDFLQSFNPKTGIFTAPFNGLYLCFLVIDCNSFLRENLGFSVFHKNMITIIENQICGTYVNKKDTIASSLGFVQMSANDELYVRPWKNYNNIELSHCSEFMCILINRY